MLGLDPVALYSDAVTQNTVDAIVGWHQAGGDLATALSSRYGCRALEATAVSTTTPGGTPIPSPSPSPRTPNPPPTTGTRRRHRRREALRRNPMRSSKRLQT